MKESAIEVFNRADVFIKDSVSLMNQFEKEASKVQDRENAETILKNLENSSLILQEDFGKDIDKLMNQFEDLQKEYANNNGVELESN